MFLQRLGQRENLKTRNDETHSWIDTCRTHFTSVVQFFSCHFSLQWVSFVWCATCNVNLLINDHRQTTLCKKNEKERKEKKREVIQCLVLADESATSHLKQCWIVKSVVLMYKIHIQTQTYSSFFCTFSISPSLIHSRTRRSQNYFEVAGISCGSGSFHTIIEPEWASSSSSILMSCLLRDDWQFIFGNRRKCIILKKLVHSTSNNAITNICIYPPQICDTNSNSYWRCEFVVQLHSHTHLQTETGRKSRKKRTEQ